MSFFGTIYADEELSHRAKTVYMYLRDRSDAEGKCWPGIKTIASDLGFPNASSFGTYFRHHIGLSPAAYRKQNH